MSVKEDLLEDLGHVYPGLTRPEIERLLTLLDQGSGTEDKLTMSIATALEPLAPAVAGRIASYDQSDDASEYVRMLRGAFVVLLQQWRSDENPPARESLANTIETIEAGN